MQPLKQTEAAFTKTAGQLASGGQRRHYSATIQQTPIRERLLGGTMGPCNIELNESFGGFW